MNDPATVLERWLLRLLPAGWEVRVTRSPTTSDPSSVELVTPSGDRTALRLLVIQGSAAEVHALDPDRIGPALLVLAAWLAPREREHLNDRNVNYVDGTGNARLVLTEPTVFLLREGAQSEPDEQTEALLRRRKAIRFMRYLVDVAPKDRVLELARSTGVSTGYVSQMLKALEAKGLVRRGRRGRLEQISLDGMLLQLAAHYDPEAFNDAYSFSSEHELPTVIEQLRPFGPSLVVTGASAAARVTATRQPGSLSAYADDPIAVAGAIGLTRTRHESNIVLMKPFQPFLTEGAWELDGTWYAAVPQIVVDCFAHLDTDIGEDLLRWTLDNVERWRSASWPDAAAAKPIDVVPSREPA